MEQPASQKEEKGNWAETIFAGIFLILVGVSITSGAHLLAAFVQDVAYFIFLGAECAGLLLILMEPRHGLLRRKGIIQWTPSTGAFITLAFSSPSEFP